MSFVYPLGLLGLIGVPILIVIYILQSKFTEQTVPSTYLWHLSEKFLKRRNPLSGLTGLISLILQILTVVLISLAIARPIFTLPNAAKNYHFVLDASSSMTMVEGKKTRFDLAKERIADVIDDAAGGSTYSLTLISGEEVVLYSGVRDKDTAIELTESASPNNTALTHEALLSSAQGIFDADTSTVVYVVTDRSYASVENLEVISVGSEECKNYAVTGLDYSHTDKRLTATADVISYVGDAELSLRLLVDGIEVAASTVSVKEGDPTPVELRAEVTSIESVTLEIVTEDGYAVDNSVTAHNLESDKSYSVLIVSDSGFFFEAAIDAILNSEIKVINSDEYESEKEEYGLYIFDGYSPSELPRGSVWLVNCDKNIEKSGFDVRARISLPEADVIERSTSTATATRALLEGVSGNDVYITDYVKYSGMYLKFSTLFSYDGNPLIFAGANGVGGRQVVFGFDIHESDFALSVDFVALLENLLNYSFPGIIDKGSYTVGEEAVVNIISNATGYRAESPSGKDVFIDDSSATAGIMLNEVGTYVVYATVSGNEVPYRIFSAAHSDESKPISEGDELKLSGERTYDYIDGEYDPIVVLFICLAILFIADWGVYCYEKYQLR